LQTNYVAKIDEITEASADLKDLLKKLLSKDPVSRPGTVEVLAHPWFAGRIEE